MHYAGNIFDTTSHWGRMFTCSDVPNDEWSRKR